MRIPGKYLTLLVPQRIMILTSFLNPDSSRAKATAAIKIPLRGFRSWRAGADGQKEGDTKDDIGCLVIYKDRFAPACCLFRRD